MPQKLSLPHAAPAIGNRSAASTSWGTPLPMPRPRTPPRYPDINGRRRMAAEFDLLTKEILLLEGELELLKGFCPASMCCKEILEFTESKSDPFLDLGRGNAIVHQDNSLGAHSVESDDTCCSCSPFKGIGLESYCQAWEMS